MGLRSTQRHLSTAASHPDVLHVQRHRPRPLHGQRAVPAARDQRTRVRLQPPPGIGSELGQRAPELHPRVRRRGQPGQRCGRRRPAGLCGPRSSPGRFDSRHAAGDLFRRAVAVWPRLRPRAVQLTRVRLRAGQPGCVHQLHRQARGADERGESRALVAEAQRLQPVGLRPGHRQNADALPAKHPRPGPRARSISAHRQRPVHRHRRRPPVLDRRRIHDRIDVSVLAGAGLSEQRHQLHAELGQGGDRRLRRQPDLLRGRPERPADQGLSRDVSFDVPIDGRHAAGNPRPHSGPPRPVRRPGPDLRHLPHDRPQGLLLTRGRLGCADRSDIAGEPATAGPALLRAVSLARRAEPRVPSHHAVHPSRQDEPRVVACRAQRWLELRPVRLLRPAQGPRHLRSAAGRKPHQPGPDHLARLHAAAQHRVAGAARQPACGPDRKLVPVFRAGLPSGDDGNGNPGAEEGDPRRPDERRVCQHAAGGDPAAGRHLDRPAADQPTPAHSHAGGSHPDHRPGDPGEPALQGGL